MSDRPPQDPLLGAQLGSCLIERPLGAGGMSAVYLARQERPRRYVALKVVRPSLTPDRKYWPLFLARFRREADAMAALDHANITPIYEFGEQDDLAYLVMPYLPDGSLADLLAREGPLPVERVVAYVDQVAAALDYAHQHGIIHRDVKPSNVLLHPDGRLLLSDFGIARPLDQRDLPGTGESGLSGDGALTMAGAALGTPDFMAPEQVLGRQVGPAADVYALGSLTYTLLAGRTPFGSSDAQQTLARQLREPPQPLRLDRPDIPARVEEAIFWALAKDPTARPASAGALAQALRNGLRGGPLAVGAALWRRAATPGSSLSSYAGSGGLGQAGRPPTPPVMEPMGPSSPNAVTVWDPRFDAGGPSRVAPSAARAWPGPGSRRTGISISPLMMAAIGLALVALLAMAGTVGGLIGSNNTLGGLLGPGATPSATSLPTATPSPSPSPSPTPPANWLSVDPLAISLGCDGDTRSQTITLTNLGPSKLGWQEHTRSNAFLGITGVTVRPDSGRLGPHRSVTITVTNSRTSLPNNSGELDFVPGGDNAGDTVVVTYSTNCDG